MSRIIEYANLDRVYETLPSRIHPLAETIEASVRSWVRDTKLVTSEETAGRVDSTRLGEVCARMFPAAHNPVPIARYLTWVAVADDVLDQGELADHGAPDGLLTAELRQTLRSGRPPEPPWRLPVLRVLAALWPEVTVEMTEEWRRRFGSHLAASFEVVPAGHGCRHQDAPPDLATYIHRRRRDGLFQTMIDMGEVALGYSVSPDVSNGPTFRRLRDAVTDVITWSNDLASLEKELSNGEKNNLVTILHREIGSWHGASAKAIDMIEQRLHEFFLLAHDEKLRVGGWVRMATYLMRGLHEWNSRTPRYQMSD